MLTPSPTVTLALPSVCMPDYLAVGANERSAEAETWFLPLVIALHIWKVQISFDVDTWLTWQGHR